MTWLNYILPHINYCCNVHSGETSVVKLIDCMVKFQKRAARIILDTCKSIETLFAELNWVTFPDRVKIQKSVLMFKIFNNLNILHILRIIRCLSKTTMINCRKLCMSQNPILNCSVCHSHILNAFQDHVKQSTP